MKLLCQASNVDGAVRLLEWFELGNSILLVLERSARYQDLYYYLFEHGRLSEKEAKPIFRQVFPLYETRVFLFYVIENETGIIMFFALPSQLVEIVKDIEEVGIIHHDIKPENILIKKEPNTDVPPSVLLVGFSSATKTQHCPFEKFHGVMDNIPPEWITNSQCRGIPLTVWTLGLMLCELVCGYFPFENRKEIVENDVSFNGVQVTDEFKELVLSCLHSSPDQRATFDDILSHSWLS